MLYQKCGADSAEAQFLRSPLSHTEEECGGLSLPPYSRPSGEAKQKGELLQPQFNTSSQRQYIQKAESYFAQHDWRRCRWKRRVNRVRRSANYQTRVAMALADAGPD